jgi:hypothetical protein
MLQKDIQSINITQKALIEARERAKKMGVLKNSFMKGDGNLVGCLGEILVRDYLGAILNNTFNHDLLYEQYTIDVKSKGCNTLPTLDYECSVPIYVIQYQNPDIYVFVRISRTLKIGWILGCLPKKIYLQKAYFIPKGQVDSNGTRFRVDTYNLRIKDLYPIKSLLKNKDETKTTNS